MMQKTYRVELTLRQKGKKYVVFALPETNQYQTIQNLSLRPSPINVNSDKWGNMATSFSLNDVGNISIKFMYSPKSVKKIIPDQFSLKDYKKGLHYALYYKSSRFVNGGDKTVQKLARSALNRQHLNLAKTATLLYELTLKYLTYGKPTEGLYPYSQALKEKITDCGGYSTFLLSLLQSIGIPGRLLVGFLLSKYAVQDLSFGFFSMHAWPEILLPDGTWFPVDPSIEWRRKKGLTKREGGFGEVPADRLVVSYGFDHEVKIDNKKYKIDIFQNPVYL